MPYNNHYCIDDQYTSEQLRPAASYRASSATLDTLQCMYIGTDADYLNND